MKLKEAVPIFCIFSVFVLVLVSTATSFADEIHGWCSVLLQNICIFLCTSFIICLSFWEKHIAFASLLAKWSFGIFLLVKYFAYEISLLVAILCRWFSVEQKQVHAFQNAINIFNNPLQTKRHYKNIIHLTCFKTQRKKITNFGQWVWYAN